MKHIKIIKVIFLPSYFWRGPLLLSALDSFVDSEKEHYNCICFNNIIFYIAILHSVTNV